MIRCIGITKDGKRCSRMIADNPTKLCFQHQNQKTAQQKTTTQKTAPIKPRSSSRRKLNIRKGPCVADPSKYEWIIGKGCFENIQSQPEQPTKKVSSVKLRCSKNPSNVWVGKGCFEKRAEIVDKDLRCENLDCAKTIGKDAEGFSIMSIPMNYYLFRGSDRHLLEKDVRPRWYSDDYVAKLYDENNCKQYIIKRDLRLIDISDIQTIRAMLKSTRISAEDKHIISLVTGVDWKGPARDVTIKPGVKYDMVFKPVIYLSNEDRRKGEYVNVKFAKIVCTLGYDGWIIPANHKVVDGSHGWNYGQEVMLCDSTSVLEYTGIDC